MTMPLPPFPPDTKRENTFAHIMLSICTLGFWAPIWAIMRWRKDAQNKRSQREFREANARYGVEMHRYLNNQGRNGY